MSIEILNQPLASGRLVGDYLRSEGEARRFYTGHPGFLDLFRVKLDEVNRRFGPGERQRAATAMRPSGPAAQAALQGWLERGGAVVTTGQQAGLFGGPLYTVYKIVTAIRLARELEARLQVPVLPLFWVASEDHDWAEVDHAELVGWDGDLHRLSVRPSGPRPVAVSEQVLGPDVLQALERLAASLGDRLAHAPELEAVHRAYQPGVGMAAAFRALVAEWFAPHGLLTVDASDLALKHASMDVLGSALADAAAHERVLLERERELRGAGYGVQVPIVPDSPNLFFHGPAGRERLRFRDGELLAPRARRRAELLEWIRLLRREPARLSPNVLLRPVVESSVFPTLAYVGGPAELAYFAQAEPLFGVFGIQPPVAFPRASFTLVNDRARAALTRIGLTADQLGGRAEKLVTELVRERTPAPVSGALGALRSEIASGFQRLAEAGQSVGAAPEALGRAANRALAQVARADEAIRRQTRVREQAALGDLTRALRELRPRGEPQERVLCAPPFFAQAGPELLERLLEQTEIGFEP